MIEFYWNLFEYVGRWAEMANITKTYVEKEAKPKADGSQALYFDDQIKGFGIRVTSGSKTFILDRKLNGKTIRVKIGRYPDWSVQQGRERAKELIVEMDKGNDIRQQWKQKAESEVTLRTVFDLFLEERQLKPRSQKDYQRYLEHYLDDWLDRPISRLDANMVMARYKRISTSSSGQAQASSVMRALRSVLNFAIATYGRTVLPENPVASLTEKRAWHRDKVRTDHLRAHEIKSFVLALRGLPNLVMASYLEFVLLTGARRNEAAQLKWKDIDSQAQVLTFRETKNHSDRVMPITPRVSKLLAMLRKHKNGEYVFASLDRLGKPTYIKEPRKAIASANAAAKSIVTVHGLRRTFATFLEALDCPAYALKALLGHSLNGDVTSSHYTQISVERLRPWAIKYEQHVLALAGSGDATATYDTLLPCAA
jgi:integrase